MKCRNICCLVSTRLKDLLAPSNQIPYHQTLICANCCIVFWFWKRRDPATFLIWFPLQWEAKEINSSAVGPNNSFACLSVFLSFTGTLHFMSHCALQFYAISDHARFLFDSLEISGSDWLTATHPNEVTILLIVQVIFTMLPSYVAQYLMSVVKGSSLSSPFPTQK